MTIDGSRPPSPGGNDEPTLAGLVRDLGELRDYLEQRGRHSYALAQRFLENARRDPSARAYDERQAAMLEYQHYIWYEIAGLVNKLLVAYGGETGAEGTAGHEGKGDTDDTDGTDRPQPRAGGR
jgi:hypothetical protein